MKRILSIALVAAVLVGGGLVSIFSYLRAGAMNLDETGALNYLFLGTDQASGNTDAMMLLGYRPKENSLTIMQIPRDTYYETDGKGMKINHLYPTALSMNMDEEKAICFVAESISESFSIPIHGVFLFRLETLSSFVDAIGGVPMDIPFDMQYTDEVQGLVIDLKKGEHTLTGEEAMQFVRFRSDYLMGDIGRLDAQKLFIGALYQKLFGTPDLLKTAASFFGKNPPLFSCQNLSSLTRTFAYAYSHKDHLRLTFLSMPGEAAISDGAWYYIPNKKALYEVLRDRFAVEYIRPHDLDQDGRFYKRNDASLENIYFASEFEYPTYDLEDIRDITITKKE